MFNVDKELMYDYITRFYFHVKKHTSGAVFSSFEGNEYLFREEGYKTEIFFKARQIFADTMVRKEDIGTGKVRDMLSRVLNICGNLVNFNQIVHAKNKLLTNLEQAEEIVYDIYYGVDEELAFEKAADFFGRKYDLLAYLFFVKDYNRFLPIRPNEFDKRFKLFGLDFKTANKCSWSNYMRFIGIIRAIKELMEESFGFSVRLIDAHSFVWMTTAIDSEPIIVETIRPRVIFQDTKPVQKEKEAVLFVRIGQGAFRNALIKLWGEGCSVTNCGDTRFLIASHIKPWAYCRENNEWINPYNGLLLTPNLDRAFDQGLISFEDNGKIIVSSSLSERTLQLLGISDDMCLKYVYEENLPFLKYHRENMYKN